MPLFSIIIPVKPGGKVAALEALRALEYDQHGFEILVAEGTAPSRQRNQAARQARGELLYFLDDDSRPVPRALTLCAASFADGRVAVVGGPSLTPAGDTPLQRLFGAALASPFGAGSVRNRYRASGTRRVATEQELILCNLACRRELFLASGGFDERLYPNEENELLDRIAARGHLMLHDPAMAVERSQRPTLRAFMRQMFGYGRGRAQQTLLAGPGSPVSFVPLLFVLYLMVIPLLPAGGLKLIPLAAYGVLATLSGFIAVLSSRRPERFMLALIFPLMHCCNGLGMLRGFVGGRPVPKPSGEVRVRQVKEFGQTSW